MTTRIIVGEGYYVVVEWCMQDCVSGKVREQDMALSK
jgi:hypothetical protein